MYFIKRFRRFAVLAGCILLAGQSARPISAQQAATNPALDRYLRFAEASRQQNLRGDQCPFSPAAVVMRVGTDPNALAAYVREHVAYEPYAGMLRGPQGTLAAGAGGDWDRAILLQATLAEAGYASKLVVIDRSDAAARAVVDGFLKRALPAQAAAPAKAADPDAATTDLLSRFGLPAENYRIHSGTATARWNGWISAAFDAAAGQAPQIRQAIGTSVAASFYDKVLAPLLAGARQRVLVEVQAPDGAHVLSPGPETAVPDAQSLEKAQRYDQVPPEQIAHFTLQLLMNVSGGEAAGKPVMLLQRTDALADLALQPIHLELIPSGGNNTPPADWTARQWYDFISGFKQFQAILHVGAGWQSSKVFDLEGNLHDVTADGQIESAQQVGAGVQRGFGGFGGALGGGSAAPPKPATHLQSLVLAIQIDLPGQPPIRQQRLIYEPQLRPGMTPVYSADLLIAGGPIRVASIAWMELDAVTRNAAAIGPVLTSGHAMHADLAGKIVRFPSVLYQWQLARLALDNRLLAGNPALTIMGGPLAAMRTTQLRLDLAGKSIANRQGFDVVLDRHMLLPRAPAASQAAFNANLAGGVGETVLESEFLRTISPSVAVNVRGAWAAFEDARAAGATPVLHLSAQPGQVAQMPPLVGWALANNPEPNAVSLFPRAGALEWWQIDPATGRALGRGEDGAGQSSIEYYQCVKTALSNLECVLGAAKGALSGDSANKTSMSWLGCITGASNPGTYVSGAGNVKGVLDDSGGGIANIGDCMYGLYDLKGSLSGG